MRHLINYLATTLRIVKKEIKSTVLILSLLPNTELVVSSGSEQKMAKIFPKSIQAVKKRMFSFPILLQRWSCEVS